MKLKPALLISLGVMSLASCNSDRKSESHVPARTVFFEKSGMDTTVSPGENFFLYANGKWMKETEIPGDQTGWGSFYTLYEDNQKNLKTLIEDAISESNSPGSVGQKVADLYASGMDTMAIEKLGYDPIKPLLEKIDAVKDYKQLLNLSADGYKNGNGFLFGVYIGPDDRISTKNAVNFSQASLNLPNRDYYFNADSATVRIRNEYLRYIKKLFTLTGTPEQTAVKDAEAILKLETLIAASHSTPVELRDPVKNYNKFAVADLQKELPDLNVRDILNRMMIKTDTVLVGQPKYYKALNDLLKNQPIEVWKAKLKFKAISDAAPALSKSFSDARFEFYGKTLSGQKVQTERWNKMVQTVDGGLGELLGQLYAERYFKPEAKERMLSLVNNLQQVYKSRIEKLDWMSNETKQRALAKLEAFTKKIGYPDTWKKYDDVTIDRSAYYQNLQSIAKHDYKEMVSKMGKPVDRTEWGMTPPTVNAYYNPSFNEIVFPAGILQFPFFDFGADDAINYGAIGAVIGHEMTHGFDDQGRQYDKDGNLKDWWTPADAKLFTTKANVVVDQYNKFTVLDNQKVNGSLTLGENLADIGGVAIAYEAFKLTDQGKGDVKVDGFTPDQRFFLSYAQVWRIKNRDETLRMRIQVDPHSPEMFRVNGPLSNMSEFYRAFDVKPGDKMYKPENERVKVW